MFHVSVVLRDHASFSQDVNIARIMSGAMSCIKAIVLSVLVDCVVVDSV